MLKHHTRRLLSFILTLLWASGSPAAQHPLTLDDLFSLSALVNTSVSPDGEWIAATITRPVTHGEVYGRQFYERDFTRSDIWLISRRTGERRNLTQGAADANGFWCASWSPDGQRIALLSTKAEAGEPRGGDNVRLYVWDRKQETLSRMTSRGVLAETDGGFIGRISMRPPASRGAGAAFCSNDESAPYLWLDDHTLLTVVLPEGKAPGILDAYSRAAKHTAATMERLQEGMQPTVSAVESGGKVPEPDTVSLQRIDVASAKAEDIATFASFPWGLVQVALAPNGRSAAILAATSAIAPSTAQRLPAPDDPWWVNNRIGFIDLQPDSVVRWVSSLPAEARFIHDLLSWSPDGSAIAFRARQDSLQPVQALFVASAKDSTVVRVSPDGYSPSALRPASEAGASSGVFWTHDGRLLMRAVRAENEPSSYYTRRKPETVRTDWWRLDRRAKPVNLTAQWRDVPADLQPANEPGKYVGIADGKLWSLDARSGAAKQLTTQPLPTAATIVWPNEREVSFSAPSELLIRGTEVGGKAPLAHVTLGNKVELTTVALPSDTARFESYTPSQSLLMLRDPTPTGVFVWAADAVGGQAKKILALNEQMADVAFGERRLIKYRGIEGEELSAGVILPPDYQPGRKYPTLLWVYAGLQIRDLSDDSLGNLYKPGQYNLQLYAARGYVVLIPSMPLKPSGAKNDHYIDLPKGVMPAIDKLIELGIADPQRLAVMGQSFGGYSTYSLVTYTNRFKAAIAMAGLTNFTSLFGQFDVTARGYDGFEHQKSANAGLLEQSQVGVFTTPSDDLWRYLRNSPQFYLDRVQTPLLLIHGEQDIRGPMTQAEEFFFGLYRQGKRAKLLRYWAEDHGLRLSPANVRSIIDEIFDWLAINMPESPAPADAQQGASKQ